MGPGANMALALTQAIFRKSEYYIFTVASATVSQKKSVDKNLARYTDQK